MRERAARAGVLRGWLRGSEVMRQGCARQGGWREEAGVEGEGEGKEAGLERACACGERSDDGILTGDIMG